jgi:hypothetical protein
LSSLKDFQRLRLVELATLRNDLQYSAAREAGIEPLDQHRQEQYHESEKKQQKLREHLQRLHLLTSQEGFQLEILGQRLVWSQQLAESKTEVESSIKNCQGNHFVATEVIFITVCRPLILTTMPHFLELYLNRLC